MAGRAEGATLETRGRPHRLLFVALVLYALGIVGAAALRMQYMADQRLEMEMQAARLRLDAGDAARAR